MTQLTNMTRSHHVTPRPRKILRHMLPVCVQSPHRRHNSVSARVGVIALPRSSPTKFTREVHPRSSHIRACWRDVHDAIMVINHGKRVLGLKSESLSGSRTGSLSGSTLDSLNSSAQLSFVNIVTPPVWDVIAVPRSSPPRLSSVS